LDKKAWVERQQGLWALPCCYHHVTNFALRGHNDDIYRGQLHVSVCMVLSDLVVPFEGESKA